MKIHAEFIEIAQELNNKLKLPKIKRIHIPIHNINQDTHKNNFLAVELTDGSVGLSYILFDPIYEGSMFLIKGIEEGQSSPIETIKYLQSYDPLLKTIGMATFNAISHFFFQKVQFAFDITTDPFGLLELKPGDTLGMVGFFKPLIPIIERLKIRCIIIEKKESLVQKKENWEVTLNSNSLEQCNKVFCTSSTILNDTIDDILSHCHHTQKFSIVGPTAGFIPDPLFNRGVDVVGGTCIIDSANFLSNLARNIPWGKTGQKYCIEKIKYRGFKHLLSS